MVDSVWNRRNHVLVCGALLALEIPRPTHVAAAAVDTDRLGMFVVARGAPRSLEETPGFRKPPWVVDPESGGVLPTKRFTGSTPSFEIISLRWIQRSMRATTYVSKMTSWS